MNKNAKILEVLIEDDFGLNKESDNWGRAIQHSSLVLDYRKGLFFWNKKGIAGDPLVYLTRVRLLDFSKARDILKNFNYTGTHVYTVKPREELDVIVYPKLVEVFYEDGKSKEKRDYLYRRGLTDETINKFQLGWFDGYNMIPFFMDGTFRNFQMRRDQPTKRIKGYYRDVGPLLFNSDILTLVNKIFIAEGPVDALALIQNGLPAISTNSGGIIRPEWYGKFTDQVIIYLVMDNDEAGVNEAKISARNLGTTRCKIYTFSEFEQKGYDPVDFFSDGNTKEDFLELIEKESKYIWEIK